ncbi:MAG: COG1361 family protein [Planctomycetota bacterium]
MNNHTCHMALSRNPLAKIHEIRRTRAKTWMLAPLVALTCSPALAQSRTNQLVSVARKAYPTGNASTSVVLIERFAPSEIRAGIRMDYVVRLTNLTSSPLVGLILEEQLPADFTVAQINPAPERTTDGRARWRFPMLGAKEMNEVRVSGTPSKAGELVSCASVTFSTETCSRVPVVQPELVMTKTMPPSVLVCDTIPIRIVVSNNGTGLARDVRVTDQLPQGWTSVDGQTEISRTVGDLPAGQSREITIQAKSSRIGDYQNEASATGAGGLAASARAGIKVLSPLLTVDKTGPDVRYLGRPAVFNLTVKNSGDAAARDAVLRDQIPSGLTFNSASDGGRLTGNEVVWNLGTINAGDSRSVSITFTPTQQGMFENRARVDAYCAEDRTAVSMEARGIPAILLEVIDIEDPIEVGASTTYEIRVLNQGTAHGTGIMIVCEVAPEQVFVSASGPTGFRDQGKRVTFDPLLSLAPKAEVKFFVSVKGQTASDARFKVSLTSNQLERPVEETESTHIYE